LNEFKWDLMKLQSLLDDQISGHEIDIKDLYWASEFITRLINELDRTKSGRRGT
jgi:hypothetical protein